MARRDPLLVLARLRALERDAARRALGRAQGALTLAEAAAVAVADALALEARGTSPSDYAAWLPAAGRARLHAAGQVRQTEAGAALARSEAVAAHAAAEAVEQLLQRKRLAQRRARLAGEQALLDDLRR
jgi:hypothetical protein